VPIADDVGSKEVDTESVQAKQMGRKGRIGSRKAPIDPRPNDGAAVSGEAGTGASRRHDACTHAANAPRDGSKLSGVIALVEQAQGATLDKLIATTGWLPHTTRAALTGPVWVP